MYQNDLVAVQFDIANVGGSSSGPWYFSANLPTSPMTPYVSPQQASLTPGAHIVNTLKFDHVMSGGGNFTVTVDPANIVQESNENNNTASQWVSGGADYYPPQTYNQNPYQY
jgi:hypothetical protein